MTVIVPKTIRDGVAAEAKRLDNSMSAVVRRALRLMFAADAARSGLDVPARAER